MTDPKVPATGTLNRRSLLGLGAAAAAGPLLTSGCSRADNGDGGGSGETIKFWNMPWGNTQFAELDKQITADYEPSGSLPDATYQQVQWANFTSTFATAVASGTGPAVSSGGGTQAFQFAEQGKIAYADGLLEQWKQNGLYDDFLPGLIDTMKTAEGYVGVPYHLDLRLLWYRKALLDKAGVEPPTDWQSYLDVCAALKKIDTFGFGIASGPQGNGFQVLVGLMINNGGGLFNADQRPDCVTPANIEALEFVVEMVDKGYMDPAGVGYTTNNGYEQWKAGRFAMGFEGPGLPQQVGGDVGPDISVGDPLVSAAGEKGALSFPNNIMMYTDTPSQEGSEAFLTYYFQNMAPLWTERTGVALPVLKSIASSPEFQSDANAAKMITDWQPVCKTWAAPGGDALFADVAQVDSTPAMTTFAQSLLSRKSTPKEALTTLQDTLAEQIN